MTEAYLTVYDGRRVRRHVERKHFDPSSSFIKHLEDRVWMRNPRFRPYVSPLPGAHKDLRPTSEYPDDPSWSLCSRLAIANKCHGVNKQDVSPCMTVTWSPEGRRVVAGMASGEISLWMAPAYNFETIFQLTDSAVRALVFSHNEKFMVVADEAGFVRYYLSYDEKVKFQAHKEPIADLSFAPTDEKFVTCSVDHSLRLWDFGLAGSRDKRGVFERELRGHGDNVNSAQWHPQTSLIASGSKVGGGGWPG